jgi:hypothetical protein
MRKDSGIKSSSYPIAASEWNAMFPGIYKFIVQNGRPLGM